MNAENYVPNVWVHALVLLVLFISGFAHASNIAYTDGEGRSWARLDETNIFSFNELSNACPVGEACGTIVGSAFDVTGWIFASRTEVTDLFLELFPDENNITSDIIAAQIGFGITEIDDEGSAQYTRSKGYFNQTISQFGNLYAGESYFQTGFRDGGVTSRLSKRPCFIVIILLLFGFHLKNS